MTATLQHIDHTTTNDIDFLNAHKKSMENKIQFYLFEIKTLRKTLRGIKKLQKKNEDFLNLVKSISGVNPELMGE